METALVVATVVSLVLAIATSIVAWRLIRAHRQHTAARVEALAALARSEPAAADDPLPSFAAPAAAPSGHSAPVAARFAALDEPAAAAHAPSWDAALHPSRAATSSADDTPGGAVATELFSTTAGSGRTRRWIALAAGLVITVGVASMFAFGARRGTTNLIALFSPGERRGSSANRAGDPLELLSLRHASDDTGTFTITGLVHNPAGGSALRRVVAVVYLFDHEGRYFASGRTPLDLAALQPGDESPFMVKVPGVTGVSRYRVGFRLEDGGVVAHVDRRGQAPGGTSGDAIETDRERSIVAPIAAPRRSEG